MSFNFDFRSLPEFLIYPLQFRRTHAYMQDELLWAGSWLYVATKQAKYHHFITEEAISNSVAEFNWDLKYAGAQILLTEVFLSSTSLFKGMNDYYNHLS